MQSDPTASPYARASKYDEKERLLRYKEILGKNRSILTSEEDETASFWGRLNALSVVFLILQFPLGIRWFRRRHVVTPEESKRQWQYLIAFAGSNFILSYVSSSMLNFHFEKFGEKYLSKLSDYELENFQAIYMQQ